MLKDALANGKDLSNFCTSKVTGMSTLFKDATLFNQDLTQWCVSNISNIPNRFSDRSGLTPANHPVWGTCP
mgnify:CR=1 FL=1|tara:strand:+ start:688 stop:900 length:213 start_codon:yes stop_codon:yes gene_type:complete